MLYSVTLFRRVKDEFAQKAREKKCVALSPPLSPTASLELGADSGACACRFVVRDFTYDEEAIEKQKRELEALVVEEKDMWVRRAIHFSAFVRSWGTEAQAGACGTPLTPQPLSPWQADLLRLSRINFSELFQVLVHLKVVRAYVESVLRYGLPAAYFGAVIKVRLVLPLAPLSLCRRHAAAQGRPG